MEVVAPELQAPSCLDPAGPLSHPLLTPFHLARSVGCILAELLLREPLFKGSDYIDQLRKIVACVGRPADKELDFIASSRARDFVRNLEGKVCRTTTDQKT